MNDIPRSTDSTAPLTQGECADPASRPPQVEAARVRVVGKMLRMSIVATVLASLITISLEAAAVWAVDGASATVVPSEDVAAYDLADPRVILVMATQLAASACWLVWQFRVATVTGPLRRSRGWHVGAWFIPVAAWWLPFQNVADLARASRAAVSVGALRLWWTFWLASAVSHLVATGLFSAAESRPMIAASSVAAIVGELFLIAAAPLAWLVVKRITEATAAPAETRLR